jgi:hypothetical protein
MKTIAIELGERPQLLERQILSIVEAQLRSPFDLLIFSCNSTKCVEFARACSKVLLDTGIMESQVVLNDNPITKDQLLQYVVKEMGSDLALFIADNVWLVPDSLRYLSWWMDNSTSTLTWMGRQASKFDKPLPPGLILKTTVKHSPECFAVKSNGLNFLYDVPAVTRYIDLGDAEAEDRLVQLEEYEGEYGWN